MRSTRSRRKKSLKTDAFLSFTEPFNRLNDAYVKYVLGSPERKRFTISFLNALLSRAYPEGFPAIVDVEFLDREISGKSESLKSARFDILARSSDERIFHIEIQVAREKFFMKRSFYYTAQDFVMQMQRGASYDTLKPVIYIGIMDFRLFGDNEHSENWCTLHKIMNVKTHENTLPEVEFHMLEIPLLRRRIEKECRKPADRLEELLCYFGSIGGEKLMEEIAERNSDVEDLLALERVYRMDPWLVRSYMLDQNDRVYWERYHMLEREEARKAGHEEGLQEGREAGREEGLKEGLKAGIKAGRDEGRAIGIEDGLKAGRAEGIAEARLDIVRTMRENGSMTDEQIASILKLPLDFVKNA